MPDSSLLEGLAAITRMLQQQQLQQQAQQAIVSTPSETQPSPSQTPVAAQESFFERMFKTPVQPEGGRQQTMWEQYGTPDIGLSLSSMLGNFAQAVDPQGIGGRLGGAMSKMSQGELAARNLADKAFQQRQMNLQMMDLYKALLGSQIGTSSTARK